MPETYLDIFYSVGFIEILRALVVSRIKKRKAQLEGSWIIGIGLAPSILTSLYGRLIDLGYMPRLWNFIVFPIEYYGILSLLVSMSVFLSRNFAHTSKNLEAKLVLVTELSEKLQHPVKKQFRVMLRNGRRLLRLINQLLDLSGLEAGSISLKTRPENIVQLLKGIVLSFSSLAETKRIKLKFQATSDETTVYVKRLREELARTSAASARRPGRCPATQRSPKVRGLSIAKHF
ncbi:MAG: hypothetical protein ACE5IR_20995 [bacterium]